MDLGIIRGLGSALVLISFTALVLWAYSQRNQRRFAEAALLPFADERPSNQETQA